MNFLRSCILFLGISFIVQACSSAGSGNYERALPIPDATSSVSQGDMRIGAMDLIEVTVFGVDTLDGTYQVNFDGGIKLPLIGEVDAIGKTPSELSYELERLFEEQYLQDPDVNVSIVESVGRRVTLDGAVNNPGLYPISGRITLLQAVALGGGPATNANPRKVVVFRQVDGMRHAAAFDLVSIRDGTASDPEIYGNDIVVIDGSNISESYQTTLRSIPLIALFLAF